MAFDILRSIFPRPRLSKPPVILPGRGMQMPRSKPSDDPGSPGTQWQGGGQVDPDLLAHLTTTGGFQLSPGGQGTPGSFHPGDVPGVDPTTGFEHHGLSSDWTSSEGDYNPELEGLLGKTPGGEAANAAAEGAQATGEDISPDLEVMGYQSGEPQHGEPYSPDPMDFGGPGDYGTLAELTAKTAGASAGNAAYMKLVQGLVSLTNQFIKLPDFTYDRRGTYGNDSAALTQEEYPDFDPHGGSGAVGGEFEYFLGAEGLGNEIQWFYGGQDGDADYSSSGGVIGSLSAALGGRQQPSEWVWGNRGI